MVSSLKNPKSLSFSSRWFEGNFYIHLTFFSNVCWDSLWFHLPFWWWWLFRHAVEFNSLWLHARLPCPSLSPRVCSNSCPLSQWCDPTILSSVTPFSCCPQSFPTSGSFPMSWLCASSGQSIELQLRHQYFQWITKVDFLWDWLVWPPCSPKDSQESLPAPHFKSISSSVLSPLYGPTLTSVHDYWKNHNLD